MPSWKMQKHIKEKHKILKYYMGAWISILGFGFKKAVYIDGFAGRGRYDDGSDGSPLIVLKKAIELFEHKPNIKFHAIFIEKEIEIFNLLRSYLTEISLPGNITYEIHNMEFELYMEGYRVEYEEGKVDPTFFFIDPYGYSINFDDISFILQLKKTEVLINFMYRDLNRFFTMPEFADRRTTLLGTEKWKELDIEKMNPKDREKAIIEIYKSQLMTVIKLNDVNMFKMKEDNKKTTLYYLIHGTNHFKGFKIMKDTMHKFGGQNLEYLGSNKKSYSLSEFMGPEIAGEKIFNNYEGRTIKFKDLIEDLYYTTQFVIAEIRDAVNDLINSNKIQIRRVKSKKSVHEEDILNFQPPNVIPSVSAETTTRPKMQTGKLDQFIGKKKMT